MDTLNESQKALVEDVMSNELNMSQNESEYRQAVTRKLVENQVQALSESTSADQANVTGNFADNQMAKWDPILLGMVRRGTPVRMAFDLTGVQPMYGPTSLIFCMRARYTSQTGTEALFNEANSGFAGSGVAQAGDTSGFAADAFDVGDPATGTTGDLGMTRQRGETLGTVSGDAWNEMAFSVEKTNVEAKTWALKAEFSRELQKDMHVVHGLDVEKELSNILTTEIGAEQDRGILRTINVAAIIGAQNATTPGSYDVATDGDGRWQAEYWRLLAFQIELEANRIALDTRRGRGNRIVCSANVASALAMAGVIDHSPRYEANLNIDPTSTAYAGVLSGRFPVYIDPYATTDYITVAYKGQSAWDAGIYFCPYVPLEMYRAVGENSFQPKIGFKSRSGVVANPFATISGGEVGGQSGLGQGQNPYYRKFRVTNLF